MVENTLSIVLAPSRLNPENEDARRQGAVGVKEKLVEMNKIQRFADARNCIEGKIVAVILSVLMALSFLNVSVFADAALAAENFDGEVGEKTEGQPTEPDSAATGEASAPEVVSGPTAPQAGDERDSDAPSTLPGQDVKILTAAIDGVEVELESESALPEGAQLMVELAETDEAKAAAQKGLGEAEAETLFHIYQISLVDEDGAELNLAGANGASEANFRVTMTWDRFIPSTMKVYRLYSADGIAAVDVCNSLTPQADANPNAITFTTNLLNAPFVFTVPSVDNAGTTDNGETDGENQVPSDSANPSDQTNTTEPPALEGNGDNGNAGTAAGENDEAETPETPNSNGQAAPDQPATSEPAPTENAPRDAEPVVREITLYVGETRDLSRFGSATSAWDSENPTVAEVSATGKVKALVAGSTIVRCGEVAFNVTVQPAPAAEDQGPELAYFYFLPPSEDGLKNGGTATAVGSDVSGAKFLGSGLVEVPYGYDGYSTLVDGTVIPFSKDANGKEIRNKVVNLDDLIVATPSSEEIVLGLRAYYNGSLDANRSSIEFKDITDYSYEVVRVDGKSSCVDYNGNTLTPQTALRVYVQMRIKTADLFTVTYKVASPTGLLTHAVLHKMDDPDIELSRYDAESGTPQLVAVDGASYHGALRTSEDGVSYCFDGWYLDGRYRQMADVVYGGKDSATFYARYLSREAHTATFNANGGAFADETVSKSVRVDKDGAFWLPEAPERFGYEFVGWVNEATGSLFAAGSGLVMGEEDVTYAASWSPSKAAIVLNAGEGTFNAAGTEIRIEGETGGWVDHGKAMTPVLPGYRFVGWNTAADGSGTPVSALPDTFAAGTMTLYAQYKEDPEQYYTVTYTTSSNGTLSRPGSVATSGTQLFDRNLVGPEAAGIKGATAISLFSNYYTFTGWFKLTSSNEGQVLREFVTSDPTLTPAMVAEHLNYVEGNCADTVFEACFDYNHATATDNVLYLVEYYVMGDDGAYPAKPARVHMDSLQQAVVGGNYAVPERYIGIKAVGDTPDLSFLEPGHMAGGPGVEPIEGFEADRYALDTELTTKTATYDPSNMLTFKVYLGKRLGIRFEAAGHGEFPDTDGEGAAVASPEAIEYRLLKGTAFPEPPAVKAHAGYRFTGWKAGESVIDNFSELSVDRAITLTAQYKALAASISFESNGGSAVEQLTGVTDAAVSATLPTPQREGYTLVGWYDNASCEGEALTALPKTFPAGNTIYYAKWTADGASIVFDRNAADVTGSQPGVKGATDGEVWDTFPEGTGFMREGYVFAGWNTKADGTGETVTDFPATFAPGTTTYYAQWKLDVRGLTAASFSRATTYNGRMLGIAMPSSLKMKDGEALLVFTEDGRQVANPLRFAKDVADSAANLKVVIRDAKGKDLASIEGVSVAISPATLTVTTSSVVYPFDGNAATSAGIAVTGLQNGETVGYRATGQAFQVGDEVENGFELTWAAAGNSYTAKSGNYTVKATLGTIRVVSSECPVKVEGYVGVYDGAEHAISYEVAAEEAAKATIRFDAPTAYTNAGTRTINYTVNCADHGTTTGSIDLKILPRPVTIAVDDSFKIAATADPDFTGSIVEGSLVQPDDLGAISFVRANDSEEIGFYPDVLTANYLRNSNYDVDVAPGTFTIGPAGSTVVPPSNPLLPPSTPSSLGAGMPAGATTPAGAIAGVVTTMVGPARAQAVAEQFGAVAGIILDDEVPMASAVSFDDETPTVTRIGGEVIEDDATAMGAFDEPHCWVHWAIAIGILLTLGYAAAVVANRLGYARKISDFDDRLTGVVATETEETRAARAAHRA